MLIGVKDSQSDLEKHYKTFCGLYVLREGFIHPAGRVVISIYRALTSASLHLGSSDEAPLALKRPGLTELRPALPGTEVWYP